ncbi:MAG TPA: SRPBCC family protein [Acidimicrobiales bacterium]|nr:SRPBCC family protein [Acidimicrobiales bacterium]
MGAATTGAESIRIAAPPQHVYDLIADVTRMGEWSPECRRCEWLDGATGPTVGSRFEGHNRVGPYKWSTTATVVVAEPGRDFAFTTFVRGRESTRWRYTFEPAGSETVVTESYEFIWAPAYVRFSELFINRDKQLHTGMRKTLERVKAVAEA